MDKTPSYARCSTPLHMFILFYLYNEVFQKKQISLSHNKIPLQLMLPVSYCKLDESKSCSSFIFFSLVF